MASPDESHSRDPSDAELPSEEVRFAVVLNGGVSLAVWMGGVVRELDRLTKRHGVYGELLRRVNAKARADVISGTSAGGINGAALAVAQANQNTDIGVLRDVWAEQGRMESLLRQPFTGQPASLLKGDDYFLPQLHAAFERMLASYSPPPKDEDRPIDLSITTTLLRGATRVDADALGQALPQQIHEQRFRFVRGVEEPELRKTASDDDFDPRTDPDIAGRLALAARCTAGFPIAFEPCFVPARHVSNGGAEPLGSPRHRPDMSGFISWSRQSRGAEVGQDRSRFAVDGGLLANTPTRRALEAIDRMPASEPVRRVMLLVYPHAPEAGADPPDIQTEVPSVVGTLSGLLGALSSQGSRTFVEEIEAHNKVAASRRGTRLDVLRTLHAEPSHRRADQTPDVARSLEELATKTLLTHYRQLRTRRAARDLAGRCQAPVGWPWERTRRAAEASQDAWLRTYGCLPYVPRTYRRPDRSGGGGWSWGNTAAIDIADIALDLIKWLAQEARGSDSELVSRARGKLHEARVDLLRLRVAIDAPWAEGPLTSLEPDTRYWRLRLYLYEFAMDPHAATPAPPVDDRLRDVVEKLKERTPDEPHTPAGAAVSRSPRAPGSFGRAIAVDVATVADAVCDVLPVLRKFATQADSAADAQAKRCAATATALWASLFGDLHDDAPRDDVLDRLLWLHIASWTLADEVTTGAAFPVDLVQISMQTENRFAVFSRSAEDKVGGTSIHRFGGFLKQSWRMNDWAWGRIDAATRLCQIVLSPARVVATLRSTGQTGIAFVDDLIGCIYGGPRTDLVELLAKEAATELDAALTTQDPADMPASLNALAHLAAHALHLQIAAEELPSIARGVYADRMDGANRRSRGELFLEENRTLLDQLSRLPSPPRAGRSRLSEPEMTIGAKALEALDRAGIGREPLDEEGSSDQMIRTATTAASVAVTVFDSRESGLGVVKPVTRALRGGMLLPYWVITGLTRGGAAARYLSLFGLAGGGAVLALALFGSLPAWAAALGASAVLGAFAYGALRTGTLLHGVVLLTALVLLASWALGDLSKTPERREEIAAAAGRAGTVFAVIAALAILGSLPSPLGSPLAALMRWLDGPTDAPPPFGRRLARWARVVATSLLPIVLVVGATAAIVWVGLRADEVVPGLVRWVKGFGFRSVFAALLFAAGSSVVAWWAGSCYRLWTFRRGDGEERWRLERAVHPAGSTPGWSVVYGWLYLLVAAILVATWPQEGAVSNVGTRAAALVTSAFLAGTLLLVVPLVVPARACRRLFRRLVHELEPLPSEADREQGAVQWLAAHRHSYRWLLRHPRGGDEGRLVLTPIGRRLAQLACDAHREAHPRRP